MKVKETKDGRSYLLMSMKEWNQIHPDQKVEKDNKKRALFQFKSRGSCLLEVKIIEEKS